MDEVKALLQCHNFPDDLILNMDETSIDFDMPRSSIVTKKDAREVCIRGTKERNRRHMWCHVQQQAKS